jgi:hypothetical protein
VAVSVPAPITAECADTMTADESADRSASTARIAADGCPGRPARAADESAEPAGVATPADLVRLTNAAAADIWT